MTHQTITVLDATPDGITVQVGQREPQRLTWLDARDAATRDPDLVGILRQARTIRPPARRHYHDPCEHERGICAPLVVWLDADEVAAETASAARQRALNAEIDRYRRDEED